MGVELRMFLRQGLQGYTRRGGEGGGVYHIDGNYRVITQFSPW